MRYQKTCKVPETYAYIALDLSSLQQIQVTMQPASCTINLHGSLHCCTSGSAIGPETTEVNAEHENLTVLRSQKPQHLWLCLYPLKTHGYHQAFLAGCFLVQGLDLQDIIYHCMLCTVQHTVHGHQGMVKAYMMHCTGNAR